MSSATLFILPIAALLTALAGAWVLRAYVRAGAKDAPRPKAVWPVAAILAGAVASLGLYLLVGRPDLADQPLLARVEALRAQDVSELSVEEALAILTVRAREAAPDDPRPYYFMGQLLAANGELERAAQSYEIALLRNSAHAPSALELARLRVQLSDGEMTPQTLALFQAAAALDPTNPLPWFYQALAATADERWGEAKTYWAEAQRRFPEDDPRQMMIAQMRAEAETKARAAQR